MSATIIQNFLNAGLFAIGDDDDRLSQFESAADALAKQWLKEPKKWIPAILVALDASSSLSEPILDDAENAVMLQWKTYREKFQTRPLNLLRPVIWDALATMAGEKTEFRVVGELLSRDFFRQAPLGREGPIIAQILATWEAASITETETAWEIVTTSGPSGPPKFALKLPEIKFSKVDKQNLINRLQQNSSGYGINHNSGTPIGDTIDASVNSLATSIGEFASQLETQVKGFTKELNLWSQNRANLMTRVLGIRTELLWWKESLYSQTLSKSYRDLPPVLAMIAMSQDLELKCSEPAPPAVEYLLREVVGAICTSGSKLTLSDLLDAASGGDTYPHPTVELPDAPQRICLLQAIRGAKTISLKQASIRKWLGLDPTLALSMQDWAVWLFREAQVLSLLP